MTSKNNRVTVCYLKLCISFKSHQSIHTWVTVRKRQIRVKIGDFLSSVTLKFDGWLWHTIGQLFIATPSFVHHFVAICEFKLELCSGNAQFGSKSTICRPVWPGNLTDDLEKLCHIKLGAQFHCHMWIRPGITERAKLCFDHCDLDLWPPTLTLCMGTTSVSVNNS